MTVSIPSCYSPSIFSSSSSHSQCDIFSRALLLPPATILTSAPSSILHITPHTPLFRSYPIFLQLLVYLILSTIQLKTLMYVSNFKLMLGTQYTRLINERCPRDLTIFCLKILLELSFRYSQSNFQLLRVTKQALASCP